MQPVIDLFIATAPDPVLISAADLHGRAFEKGWSRQSLEELLATPGCAMATIRTDDAVVGFIVFRGAGSEAEIITLAVAPDCRRQGLAGLLVEDLLDWARRSRIELLHLEVACDNAPALALYEKLGFTETARRQNYYKTKNSLGQTVSRDAVCMSLNVKNVVTPGS
ncbi:MAG: ribosomal protein S18-alanine N-acetyltransferase [Pseudomonadota bacterium]